MEVRHGSGHAALGAAPTEARLLPLDTVRALSARGGFPGAGTAAPAEPRHVPGRPRRRGRAPRPARALQDRGGADARGRPGPRSRGTARTPPRLPGNRGLPLPLAELTAGV